MRYTPPSFCQRAHSAVGNILHAKQVLKKLLLRPIEVDQVVRVVEQINYDLCPVIFEEKL